MRWLWAGCLPVLVTGGVSALQLAGDALGVCGHVSEYREGIRSVVDERVPAKLRHKLRHEEAEARPLLDALGIGRVVGLCVISGERAVRNQPISENGAA